MGNFSMSEYADRLREMTYETAMETVAHDIRMRTGSLEFAAKFLAELVMTDNEQHEVTIALRDIEQACEDLRNIADGLLVASTKWS
jgi:hypothetical protein